MASGTIWTRTISILAVVAVCATVHAADEQPEDRRSRLGIGPIEIIPSLQQQLTREGKTTMMGRIQESMTPQLEDRLNNSRKFRIIARDDLSNIIEEQQLAPLLDPDTAPETFRLSGIDYLVVVTVDHFDDRTESMRMEHAGRELTRRTIEIGAIAKLWNTETGELLESANWELSSEDEDIPSELRRSVRDSQVRGDHEALNRLLRRMGHIIAQRISDRVVDVIYPARVMNVVGNEVFINRGDGTDINRGEIWTVYALGEEMIDEDTGISLGRTETAINSVRIVRVAELFAVGQIVEDQNYGIERGQVLRREETDG